MEIFLPHNTSKWYVYLHGYFLVGYIQSYIVNETKNNMIHIWENIAHWTLSLFF